MRNYRRRIVLMRPASRDLAVCLCVPVPRHRGRRIRQLAGDDVAAGRVRPHAGQADRRPERAGPSADHR